MIESEEFREFLRFVGEIVEERYFTAEKPVFAVSGGDANTTGALVAALVLFGANVAVFGKFPQDAFKYCFSGEFTVEKDFPVIEFYGADGAEKRFSFSCAPVSSGTVSGSVFN